MCVWKPLKGFIESSGNGVSAIKVLRLLNGE